MNDAQRELEKIKHILFDVETYLEHQAHMNAALHCSSRVLYSPLHAQVQSALSAAETLYRKLEEDG